MKNEKLKPGRLLLVIASVAVVLPVAFGSLSQALAQAKAGGNDSIYKHLSVFTEVLSLIQRGYVDETSLTELFAGAFDGLGDGLDPLATYVPGPEVERFRSAMGIGAAHSGITVARTGGISYVIAIEDSSPAATLGVERGDIIAEIDGVSTRAVPLWDLKVRLAEVSGTAELKLLRRGEKVEVALPLGPFDRAEASLARHRGVPVLRVARLDESPLPQLARFVENELRQESRLIVDLRNVAGGQFRVAYDLAAVFATGRLGELTSRGESLETFEVDKEASWKGDLAVLIDGGTQGASEVLARILEQSAGARLVGQRSYGLAARHRGVELGADAILFLSDAFYTGPDGEPIREGLVPAERVDLRRTGLAPDAGEDPVLERAVEMLDSDTARRAA